MKYAVTVLFDASRSVTVEADTPEEAEGKAHNEVGSASLCHQCSDEIDMGDATGALVYEDDGAGPQVLDTTYSGETIARLKDALAAAEARNATLTDDAAALRLAVEHGMTVRFWGQACAQATAPGGPAAYVTANYHGDKMAAARDAITRAAAIVESGGERQRLQSDAARAAASISTKDGDGHAD